MRKALIVAHRGASAYEPENTLRAVKTAIKMGSDAVEVDVRISKDGELVVIHDERVDRTSDGEGRVRDFSVDDLKGLYLALGEKVPTLNEVISLVKGRAKLVIELKESGLEGKLVELLNREGVIDDVIVTSFIHKCLKRVKELNEAITCGIIFKCEPIDSIELASAAMADVLLPYYLYVTDELIDRAHENNLSVYAWTVDDVEVARTLISKGVDGVVTNKPDLLNGSTAAPRRAYVAGPIQGAERRQSYRAKLRLLLGDVGFEVIDPWERERLIYRGRMNELDKLKGLVKRDLLDVEASSIFVAYLPKHSAGTYMELFYARSLGKPTFIISKLKGLSPWVIVNTTRLFKSLDEFEGFIKEGLKHSPT